MAHDTALEALPLPLLVLLIKFNLLLLSLLAGSRASPGQDFVKEMLWHELKRCKIL